MCAPFGLVLTTIAVIAMTCSHIDSGRSSSVIRNVLGISKLQADPRLITGKKSGVK